MSKMFMNVKEVMEVLEVSESYAYKLMKRLNRELQAMGCQTIAGKVDRKYFYEQFYGVLITNHYIPGAIVILVNCHS